MSPRPRGIALSRGMPIHALVAIARAFPGLGALRRLAGRSPALTGALAVLIVASLALGLSHHAGPLPLTRASALTALQRDTTAGRMLRRIRFTRAEVFSIDARQEQINLYRGPTVVLEAVVRADGTVAETVDPATRATPYGSRLAYRLPLLAGLAGLFALMTGVAPLRRRRNLDVAVLLSLTAPMLLLQHRMIGASAVSAVPPLAYLAFRCLREALAPHPERPSTPLFELVTARLGERERRRLLGILAAAAAAVFALVGVSSSGAVDVVYAVMEGATKIVHGILPYGHLPAEIVHADTYPILSYAAYVPVALLEPVGSLWDSVDLALGVTVLAALAAAACAAVAVSLQARPAPPRADRHGAGLRAAIAVLAFPPLLAVVSSGTTDVALGAILVLAVVLWRRPAATNAVIAAAGWFKLAPFVLVPIWLAPLRGRRLTAGAGAIAAVSAAALAIVLALGGAKGVGAMLHAIAYQFTRGAFQSPWHALGLDFLQPFGEALVLAGVAAAGIRLRSDGMLAGDPRRVGALTVAVLIALQLAASYWAFLYLAWLAPLLVVVLLAGERADAAVPA